MHLIHVRGDLQNARISMAIRRGTSASKRVWDTLFCRMFAKLNLGCMKIYACIMVVTVRFRMRHFARVYYP